MKRAFTLIEAVIVVAIILILAVILLPIIGPHHGRDYAKRSSCQSNLKQISWAFAQYTQDYDTKFPLVSHKGLGGWSEDLQPYTKSWQLFQCPSANNQTPKTSDYFFNLQLSGRELSKVLLPHMTITSGDGQDDAPLHANLNSLLPSWKGDESSPAYRHLNGANYGFADGHVKWLKPEKISNASPSKTGGPTFAVR